MAPLWTQVKKPAPHVALYPLPSLSMTIQTVLYVRSVLMRISISTATVLADASTAHVLVTRGLQGPCATSLRVFVHRECSQKMEHAVKVGLLQPRESAVSRVQSWMHPGNAAQHPWCLMHAVSVKVLELSLHEMVNAVG